jgi:hypothetical protein
VEAAMNKLYEMIRIYYSGDIYEPVRRRINRMLPLLNERQWRLYLACEAQTIGPGGIAAISRIAGSSPDTIKKGLKELAAGDTTLEVGKSRKIRKKRKSIKERCPDILNDLNSIIESEREKKGNILHYTSKSAEGISAALKEKGLNVSASVIGNLLKEQGYNLRNSKKKEGIRGGPDVERQFIYINKKARSYLKRREAVLVIEAKELDQSRRRKGAADLAYDHDYLANKLGKGAPSACYELFRNKGFVNTGLSGSIARIAIECLGKWCETERFEPYRDTGRMLVIADFYGGDEWAPQLQSLANRIKKKITVLHFPPGITRWDGIEHRFYSFINRDREQRLVYGAVIINLIGTGENTGSTVECIMDTGNDPNGTKESQGSPAGDSNGQFHREWNYILIPQGRRVKTGKALTKQEV